MSRWFRHYAGMMRDDKLVRVAIRSGQTIERVVWVWGAILESAAEIDDEGRYDFDVEEAAYFLRADPDDVMAVVSALEGSGRLGKGAVAKWGDRQFSSDRSAERQRLCRARQKANNMGDAVLGGRANGSETIPPSVTVTSLSRHGDAPETETELETEETPIVPLAGGRRGKTFIPTDWTAPAVSELPPRSRACAEQWTEASYQTEAEAFLLYWRSERKMKSNWRDTWANRVIARHSAVMRDQKFGNAAPPAKIERAPAEAREWYLRNAEAFDKFGKHDDAERNRKHAQAIEDAHPELRNKVTSIIERAGRILAA